MIYYEFKSTILDSSSTGINVFLQVTIKGHIQVEQVDFDAAGTPL